MNYDKRAYAKLRSVRASMLTECRREAVVNDAIFCILWGLIAEANHFFLGKPLTAILTVQSDAWLYSRLHNFFSELDLDFLPEWKMPRNPSEELRYKLADLCLLDWRECSPEVLGALYELATSETDKTEGGIFFTSKRNIHRCIDPLFLDEMLDKIDGASGNREQLETLYKRLCEVMVLDPACGSGNYLIEALAALRSVETQIIAEIGEQPYRVDHRRQIFGIEIEEQSARVARAAVFAQNRICDRLEALKLNAPLRGVEVADMKNILCGDSLSVNWQTLSPKPITYIIGNPPFCWSLTEEQQEAMQLIFDCDAGSLDYSAAWIRKAAYLCKKGSMAALLVTSSVCQGQQVPALWSEIFNDGVGLFFAYKPFKWTTDYDEYIPPVWAHCVVLGLADVRSITQRSIYTVTEGNRTDKPTPAGNINGYLLDMPSNLIVEPSSDPFFMPQRMYSDRRHAEYISDTEYRELKREGSLREQEQYIPYLKAKDMLYGVRNYALRSPELDAEYPVTNYIVVCRHSSCKREYMPVFFFSDCQIVCNESVYYIPDADLYTYGLMCSLMHNVWLSCTCGRLDNNYRYSISLTFNTFPVPEATEEQKSRIEAAAKQLLEEQQRCLKDKSMAELYDSMPMILKAAHMKLDYFVDKLYSDSELFGEQQRINILSKLYLERKNENE